ncbi:MAG: signal peptidase I, partial [Actinomycetota bacterium]
MADIEARDPPISKPDTTTTADPDTSERTESDRRETDPSDQDRESHRFVGSTPFLVLVALAVAILVKTFLIQAFYIPSESMVPTLQVGDRVFVNKLAYDIGDLGRGDVIVFENPHPEQLPERSAVSAFLHWLGEGIGFAQPADEDFIKRVIGLPGETIEIRDNVVSIDGEPLDEPYLTDAARQSNGDFPETRIPAGHLFMMGDNRGNS